MSSLGHAGASPARSHDLGSRRAIVVVLDGLRRDFVSEGLTPNLAAFARRAEFFADHRSVFPSATRAASASFATGCYPSRHGLQGNTLALLEEGRLVVHDAGRPDFLEHKRRMTGGALGVPTLAARLRGAGGGVVFSNVSPGASYTHDPDGDGLVYNRAGSFGPGRVPLADAEQLRSGPNIAGDRAMVDRFVSEVVSERRPALAVLWACEPDEVQHAAALGSPAHLPILRQADLHFRLLLDAVDRERDRGADILFAVCSDHGHQTVTGVVDVNAELVGASLKDGPDSDDVLAVSNGTAALVYVHPDRADRLEMLEVFLSGREWVERLVPARALHAIGQAASHGLAFALSMRSDEEPNPFGVRGRSLVAKPAFGKPDRLGCGQHGGLARFDQASFLMVEGEGFAPGCVRSEASCLVDVAPTVLQHLGLSHEAMDGRPLQRVPNPAPPQGGLASGVRPLSAA